MIDKMDFIIDVDITMSDTAWYADLVLPAPSYLERNDPASGLQGSSACACVATRKPLVQPMFESRAVFDICKGLAQRLDLGEHFDFTMDEFREQQLSGLPGAMQALEEDGVYYNPSKVYGIYVGRRFKTLSKKIEMYNTRYEQMGLDPLPVYHAPKDVPRDKFRMVVGRSAVFTHTSTQNNKLLHELIPENTLWLHPKPAQSLGIKPGDTVTIKSDVGQGSLKVQITEGIRPDTVYMLSGFGAVSKGLSNIHGVGASMAEVLDDYADELSGNMAMHETFVTVERRGA
jgi:thiosulfate reductase/polysulfide reductase chain A